MVVYRYRLTNRDGVDLGPFISGFDDWKPGRIILRPGGDYEVRADPVDFFDKRLRISVPGEIRACCRALETLGLSWHGVAMRSL